MPLIIDIGVSRLIHLFKRIVHTSVLHPFFFFVMDCNREKKKVRKTI